MYVHFDFYSCAFASFLQYHKDQAIKFERELVKCQAELAEKCKVVETLNDSVQEAHDEVEMTRQQLMSRMAAKDLELQKAKVCKAEAKCLSDASVL